MTNVRQLRTIEELASNPEIKLVRDAGFELVTPFFIRQFFATSLDGTSELVISYGRRVANCSAISKEFKNQIEPENQTDDSR